MTKYKTSVIIPVYNTEQYLDACIRSVLGQTQKEVEIILVDDGSTDHGYEKMLSYAARYGNIKVFRQENKKLGAARNLGMKHAAGKYIFFLDSDDYIREDCLERLYQCAEGSGLDFVTYDSDILVECAGSRDGFPGYDRSMLGIAADRVYRGRDFLNSYFGTGGVFVSACLAYYSAGFLRRHRISFEEQVYYEDNGFSLEAYCCAERMMYLPGKLYVRRYRENSIMTSECGIIHLQSAMKMSEKCLRILLQQGREENKEGIRAATAIMADRLRGQIQPYRNKEELCGNQYVLDLCRFFISCDWDALLSETGLGLAWECYQILSVITDAGWLAETPDMEGALKKRTAVLGHRVQDTVGRLLAGWEKPEGKIVIYGTGDVAERIVHCFRTVYGMTAAVKNRIIFARTSAAGGEVYMGKYPVIQADRIGDYPVSVIIVASTKYEREMCARLNRLFGRRYPCVTYRQIADISIDGERRGGCGQNFSNHTCL